MSVPIQLFSPTSAAVTGAPAGGQRVNEGPQAEWEGFGMIVAMNARQAALRTLGETVSNIYECLVQLPSTLRPAEGWRVESLGRTFVVLPGVAEPPGYGAPWNLPLRRLS